MKTKKQPVPKGAPLPKRKPGTKKNLPSLPAGDANPDAEK